jgi:hypothetical protein
MTAHRTTPPAPRPEIVAAVTMMPPRRILIWVILPIVHGDALLALVLWFGLGHTPARWAGLVTAVMLSGLAGALWFLDTAVRVAHERAEMWEGLYRQLERAHVERVGAELDERVRRFPDEP